MIAAEPVTLSVQQFLKGLQASGILTELQLAKARKLIGVNIVSAHDAARVLTTAAILTAFQADRLLAGKTDGFVLGQYIILEAIRPGLSSRLYKARHRTMNRQVAVKVLSVEATRDATRRAAFQAEARLAAQLTHPNIVTVYDTNQIGDRLYIVTEYVEGSTLEEVVRKVHRLPVHQACEIARQAALGLQHMHEKTLTYGPLHPSGLILCRQNAENQNRVEVKLTNTGIPQKRDPSGASHSLDPLDFSAPELYRLGQPRTPASDLYSLGCLLHFLLTGAPVFESVSDEDRRQSHERQSVRSVRALRPNIPPGLEDLLRKLLAKDPVARFATAEEVASRLQAFTETNDTASGVDFNLPVEPLHSPSQHSGGYLSGLQAAPLSERYAQVLVATIDDTSPWSEIHSQETLSNFASPEASQAPEPLPMRTLIGLVLGTILCTLTFLALVAR
jgi:eukaryotic-like serine/threonine-protein kinase